MLFKNQNSLAEFIMRAVQFIDSDFISLHFIFIHPKTWTDFHICFIVDSWYSYTVGRSPKLMNIYIHIMNDEQL